MKLNVPIIGYILGLIFPLIGSICIYYILFRTAYSFDGYWKIFTSDYDRAAKALTLSLLFNLIPFLYCNYKRYDQTVRGIVSATIFPYCLLFLLYKFVF